MAARHLRSRRHRRRLRGTRRPIPRRRSGRPRAHMVGHHTGLCRVQSARIAPTTPDWVERRPPASYGVRARRSERIPSRHVGPHAGHHVHIEAVHRLSNVGAVVTHAAHGTSQDGFEAEWREIDILTVEGDLINRCEIFDEADLDAALARFDELQPPARAAGKRGKPSGTSASWRTSRRATGTPWRQDFADDYYCDDRRRVVNAGVRHGRDAEIARHAGGRRHRLDDKHHVGHHCDPRGAPMSSFGSASSGRDQRPGTSTPRCSTSSRSTPKTGSRRSVAVRPRRHRRRLRGTRCPVPRRRSRRPRAHWSLMPSPRRVQPTRGPRATPDWVNVDHRHGSSVRARRR